MSCNFDADLLDAFAAGVLDNNDKQKVAAHCAGCAACKETVKRQREAVHLLSSAFNEDPPDWIVQKTVSIVKHRAEKPPAWQMWLKIAPAVSVAVIVIALVTITGLSGRHGHTAKNSVALVTARRSAPESSQYPATRKSAEVPAVAPVEADVSAEAAPVETAPLEKQTESIRAILGLIFENPVNDRSIYRELGVKNEIAALLL